MDSRKTDYIKEKTDTSRIDEPRFQKACAEISARQQGLDGIGTLQEKSVHAVLKSYYGGDGKYQEVPIGPYVADICRDGEIYEIQSKAFYVMKQKLDLFLSEHDVTIIYPVALRKTLRYIDPETGEVSKGRVSSKKGHLLNIIPELYSIREFLDRDNLHFIVCFIEMEEYKFLDGYGKDRKKKATKTDRIPTKILGEYYMDTIKDLCKLLPDELLTAVRFPSNTQTRKKKTAEEPSDEKPRQFTSLDIKEATGCSLEEARILLTLLRSFGFIRKTGSRGRYHLYEMV